MTQISCAATRQLSLQRHGQRARQGARSAHCTATLRRTFSATPYDAPPPRKRDYLFAVLVRAEKDPRKRVVITGQGVVSCYGNDVDTFYDRYAHLSYKCVDTCACWAVRWRAGCIMLVLTSALCSLLAGKSGVREIERFDASTFPTRFAAQITHFDSEGCGSLRLVELRFWVC